MRWTNAATQADTTRQPPPLSPTAMSTLFVAFLLCAIAVPALAGNAVEALSAGLDYLEADQWTTAGERFVTAARLNPDLPEPHLARATLELLQGDLDVASKTFLAYTDGPCAGVAGCTQRACICLLRFRAVREGTDGGGGRPCRRSRRPSGPRDVGGREHCSRQPRLGA